MTIASYLCPACGRVYPADRPLWQCECGGHLNLGSGPSFERGKIIKTKASLWRYAAALALSAPPQVSLGEGWTPLLRRGWQGAKIHFKLESQMPTGSFKDRGTAVMLNHLLEVGVGPIHEDSSGNAGASIATYTAAAGIPCRIYVPAAAPRAKLVQIAASRGRCPADPRHAARRDRSGARRDRRRAFMPATTGNLSLSRAPRPSPSNYGSSSAFGFRTTSSFRPAMAATFSGSNAASTSSREAARSPGDRGSLPSRRRIAQPLRRPGRQERTGLCRSRQNRLSPTASRPRNRSGSPRSWQPCAGRAAASSRSPKRRSRRHSRTARQARAVCRAHAATAGAALTRLLSDGTITADQTTVVVLTGSGLKAAERIDELLGIGSGT